MIEFPFTRRNSTKDPEQLFQQALRIVDSTIRRRLRRTPKPVRRKKGRVTIYRFPDEDLDSFLLLKLVQLTSNLRAGRKLIENGFTYEWKILHRSIAESTEHVLFLVLGKLENNWEKEHDDVLAAFYSEDFNRKGDVSRQQPIHVRSASVREALQSSIEGRGGIPAQFRGKAAGVFQSLHKLKSGYVHGRAASIMSLYDSADSHFTTNGQMGSDAETELGNLWRATYSAVGGCVALSALKWFGPDYYMQVSEIAEQFRKAARVGESLDSRILG